MAFKRSAVRSRLTPPKNLEIVRFRGFSCLFYQFLHSNSDYFQQGRNSKICRNTATRMRQESFSLQNRPFFVHYFHCVYLGGSWSIVFYEPLEWLYMMLFLLSICIKKFRKLGVFGTFFLFNFCQQSHIEICQNKVHTQITKLISATMAELPATKYAVLILRSNVAIFVSCSFL